MARLGRDDSPTTEKTMGATIMAARAIMSERIARKRKQKRDKVQLHKASLFLLVIDDVERVDDRLHSGVGAPERQGEAGDESEAELSIAFCRELRDLLVEQVDCAAGQDAGCEREMRVDRRSVGDETVQRDERRDGRKDREQRIEDNPGRDGEQTIVIGGRVNAPENVLPAGPGNLPRSGRAASPPRLLRPPLLFNNRLIVLEVLLRPFIGIGLPYRRCFAACLRIRGRRGGGMGAGLGARAAAGSHGLRLVAPRRLRPRDRKPEAAILPDGPPFLSPRSPEQGRVSSREPACPKRQPCLHRAPRSGQGTGRVS